MKTQTIIATKKTIPDKRPFLERVIKKYSFMPEALYRCVYEKPIVSGDVGTLMESHHFWLMTEENGHMKSDCEDLSSFHTWMDHFKSIKEPFLVVRVNNREISIFKKRYAFSKAQNEYSSPKNLLDNKNNLLGKL